MNVTIKMAEPVYERLTKYHLAPAKREEALCYIWARVVTTPGGIVACVPHNAPLVQFSPDCFERQSSGNVRLYRDVQNGMLVNFAATDYNTLINIHDHWFDNGRTSFSGIDDHDDLTFDHYLREKFEPMLLRHAHIGPARSIHNLSIVLAHNTLDARLVDTGKREPFTTATVEIIGNKLRRLGKRRSETINAELYNRQRDFISPSGQQTMAELDVALAGCGGLGSIVAESLGRVGIGGIMLIDDDVISESNLNRWQGATPSAIGRSKAELLGRRLRRMFPHMRVKVLPKSVYEPSIERLLAEADILIGGLDNDEARYFLNRLSIQYTIPYFDAGVAIVADTEVDFLSRFFAVLPGVSACACCSQFRFFDRERILDSFIDERTLQERRAAGYVVDRPDVSAPSVYALNQRTAALLVTELTNYICGWRPVATVISESWKNGSFQRADRDNFPEGPDPECPTCDFYAGALDTEPLPRPRSYNIRNNPIQEMYVDKEG